MAVLIYSGNTKDSSTLRGFLDAIQRQYGKRVAVIGQTIQTIRNGW
jgi:hypothetical protein